MANCEIVFGALKRPEKVPIKDLLSWPEQKVEPKARKENSGKWISETEDSFKQFQQPPIALSNPIILESDPVPIVIEESPSKPENKALNAEQKPKKKNVQSKSLSRHLPNSTFAKRFEKPAFACYGNGSTVSTDKASFAKAI
jgi:hypothetical protein